MKTPNVLRILFTFSFLLPWSLFGATNPVFVGGDVQAAIDASAPGDTLFMQPGVYPNNLVFNKALTVAAAAPPSGGQIQFLGAISVANNGSNSFQQSFFGNTFDTSGGASVTVIDSEFNGPITARGGKLTLKRDLLSVTAPLVLTNSAGFDGLRTRMFSSITSYAPAASPGQFLGVQNEFHAALVLSNYKVWLGYNTGVSSVGLSGCDALLIGNKFTIFNGNNNWLMQSTAGNLKLINNLLVNGLSISGSQIRDDGSALLIDGGGAELINNTIYGWAVSLAIQNLTGTVTLRGDIIRSGRAEVVSITPNSAAQAFASYCSFADKNPQSYFTKPLAHCLVNMEPSLAADYSLNSDSPCLHTGMPEAIYRDRDPDGQFRSQNSMGYTGGPYYNPANYTNDNPMVFLLTGPQTVMKGAQITIPITAAATAGH